MSDALDAEAAPAARDSPRDPDAGDDEAASVFETPYWTPASMSTVAPTSLAAIARLRAHTPPPFPLWERLPARRRAAVLVLLYPDRRGSLRVVITMRAANLRSFPNQAALPGGKADSADECPYATARREAWEEIGLPARDDAVPPPFRIQRLCYLEHHLARIDVVVRPCVALLHVDDDEDGDKDGDKDEDKDEDKAPGGGGLRQTLAEDALIPRLDAKEVAAVFSAPFEHFLSATALQDPSGARAATPGHWYDGTWAVRGDGRWRVHNFYVPVNRQQVAGAGQGEVTLAKSIDATAGGTTKDGSGSTATRLGVGPDFKGEAAEGQVAEDSGVAEDEVQMRYKVWGMTAHVLVDAARIAYGRDPEQEHNPHFGDEDAICAAAEGWEWLKDTPDARSKS